MFHHSIDRKVSLLTAFNWFLLAFLSGSVNAGGVLSCHRFVTHVTGFFTLAGIDFGHGHWQLGLGILSVPLYFLLGVIAAALLIDRRLHRGQNPRYALVMMLVSFCLIGAALGGHYHFFGAFGGVVELKRDYLLLALLALASGLQNAAITTASGTTVRTTHMTGLTTDFGIGLVRSFYANDDVVRHELMVKANILRMGTLASFMVGSAVGAIVFLNFAYLGFLLPAAIAAYAAFQELHHHTHREMELIADRLAKSLKPRALFERAFKKRPTRLK